MNGRQQENCNQQKVHIIVSETTVVAVKVTHRVDMIKITWEGSWWGNDDQDKSAQS